MMADPGRDGNEVDLEYARGRGNVTAYNTNESVVTRLFADGLIGVAEREAADYMSKLWRRASVGTESCPELDRIPGQSAIGMTDIAGLSLTRLNEINNKLSRISVLLCGWVLNDGLSLNELNAKVGCPKGHGIEKWLLRSALMELAEVTGHATRSHKRA